MARSDRCVSLSIVLTRSIQTTVEAPYTNTPRKYSFLSGQAKAHHPTPVHLRHGVENGEDLRPTLPIRTEPSAVREQDDGRGRVRSVERRLQLVAGAAQYAHLFDVAREPRAKDGLARRTAIRARMDASEIEEKKWAYCDSAAAASPTRGRILGASPSPRRRSTFPFLFPKTLAPWAQWESGGIR